MVLGHVPEVWDLRVVVLHYFDREALDLAGANAGPSLRLERKVCRTDAVADAQVLHSTMILRGANSRTSFRNNTLMA